MSIDLEIQVQSAPIKKSFKIPDDVAGTFDLYVQAAKEKVKNVNQDIVLTAILEKHLKADKSFRTWLKDNKKDS